MQYMYTAALDCVDPAVAARMASAACQPGSGRDPATAGANGGPCPDTAAVPPAAPAHPAAEQQTSGRPGEDFSLQQATGLAPSAALTCAAEDQQTEGRPGKNFSLQQATFLAPSAALTHTAEDQQTEGRPATAAEVSSLQQETGHAPYAPQGQLRSGTASAAACSFCGGLAQPVTNQRPPLEGSQPDDMAQLNLHQPLLASVPNAVNPLMQGSSLCSLEALLPGAALQSPDLAGAAESSITDAEGIQYGAPHGTSSIDGQPCDRSLKQGLDLWPQAQPDAMTPWAAHPQVMVRDGPAAGAFLMQEQLRLPKSCLPFGPSLLPATGLPAPMAQQLEARPSSGDPSSSLGRMDSSDFQESDDLFAELTATLALPADALDELPYDTVLDTSYSPPAQTRPADTLLHDPTFHAVLPRAVSQGTSNAAEDVPSAPSSSEGAGSRPLPSPAPALHASGTAHAAAPEAEPDPADWERDLPKDPTSYSGSAADCTPAGLLPPQPMGQSNAASAAESGFEKTSAGPSEPAWSRNTSPTPPRQLHLPTLHHGVPTSGAGRPGRISRFGAECAPSALWPSQDQACGRIDHYARTQGLACAPSPSQPPHNLPLGSDHAQDLAGPFQRERLADHMGVHRSPWKAGTAPQQLDCGSELHDGCRDSAQQGVTAASLPQYDSHIREPVSPADAHASAETAGISPAGDKQVHDALQQLRSDPAQHMLGPITALHVEPGTASETSAQAGSQSEDKLSPSLLHRIGGLYVLYAAYAAQPCKPKVRVLLTCLKLFCISCRTCLKLFYISCRTCLKLFYISCRTCL